MKLEIKKLYEPVPCVDCITLSICKSKAKDILLSIKGEVLEYDKLTLIKVFIKKCSLIREFVSYKKERQGTATVETMANTPSINTIDYLRK